MTEPGWNFDLLAAPRGRWVTVTRSKPKVGTVGVEVYEPDKVILATKCGKVTASYFIPKENRWCMLAAGEQPVAWMPWPKHPTPKPEAPSHD